MGERGRQSEVEERGRESLARKTKFVLLRAYYFQLEELLGFLFIHKACALLWLTKRESV